MLTEQEFNALVAVLNRAPMSYLEQVALNQIMDKLKPTESKVPNAV